MKAILLGAERGVRRLRASDSYPLALVEAGKGNNVIDWNFAALHAVGVDEFVFVGGYHVEKLISQYPHIQIYYNSEWQHTQSLFSLFQAREQLVEECIVSHTNVLYHKEAFDPLFATSADIVVGLIPSNRNSNGLSSTELPQSDLGAINLENIFSSFIKLSQKGAVQVANFFDKLVDDGEETYLQEAGLIEFIGRMQASGVEVETVEISESWVPVDANMDMAQFILGSKSQTLERLQNRISRAEILEQVRFSVADWLADQHAVIECIQAKFSEASIVVRSSSHTEDSWQDSQAGKYHSALDVDASDSTAVTDAIEEVISSFGDTLDAARDNIFVQLFLSEIKVSGVLFSRDIETQAPYLVVNFDDETGRSDSVTSGNGQTLATSYAFKGHENRLDDAVRPMASVVSEIQELVGHDSLDIEFAIDVRDRCHILQVRPITPKPGFSDHLDQRDISAELECAAAFVTNSMGPHPLIQGSTTLYSNMTDWNPAEIIGATPRPLAATLYRHLITDEIWSKSRGAMGGREVHSVPLMHIIGGHPFIDVRASLNSFIPASISTELTSDLVDHFIARISAEPKLHDKVEFDVAITCMDFDFENKADRLQQDGFGRKEISDFRDALKKQTADIVKGAIQPFSSARQNLGLLAARRESILQATIDQPASLCRAIGMLLDDCRILGAFTFANLARQGFVANLFLQSLNKIGEIDNATLANLQSSLPTVASELAEKLSQLVNGEINRKEYLAEFGHLRPGTYDILSPSYSEEPDVYLSHLLPIKHERPLTPENGDFERLMKQLPLDDICSRHEIGFTGDEMASFIRQAIPGREWGKFEFTKSLSAALVLMKKLGGLLGFSPDDMSMLPIWKILDARIESSPSSWQGDLNREIGWNRKALNIAKTLRFPNVIAEPEDLFGFTEREDWPNFITGKSVTAPILHLEERNFQHHDYDGRIVVIEHSDPGYDWLFGHGISGLVTKYGGVASHMAIRCAEFGLPAAIGCGERVFDSICKSSVVELNCANRRISLVK